MTDVIDDISLEETESDQQSSKKGLNILGYIRTFKRHTVFIVGITTLTTVAGLAWSLFDSYTYIGNFRLLVEPVTSEGKLTDPSVLTRTGGVPDERLLTLDYPSQLEILKGQTILEKIATRIEPKMKGVNDHYSVDYLKSILAENLSVNRVKVGESSIDSTKIIEVSFKGENPDFVKLVLEITAEEYRIYSQQQRQTNIIEGVNFIEKQVPELQDKIDKIQLEIQTIQEQYSLTEPVSRSQELFTQIHQLESEKIQVENQIKEQQELYNNLQKKLDLTPEQALVASALTENPERQSILAKIQDIEAQIAIVSSQLTPNHPNLQTLENQRQNLLNLLQEKNQEIIRGKLGQSNQEIFNFQNSLRIELINQLVTTANNLDILKVRYGVLQENIQLFKKQSEKLPNIIRRYSDLTRQLDITVKILDQLRTQKETLRLEATQTGFPWRLISDPEIPKDKFGRLIGFQPDRKKKILAGMMVGFILSAALSIWLEKRQDIFFSYEDIQDIDSQLFLGKVLDLDQHKNLHDFQEIYSKIRFLYANISLKSLTVCSVESGNEQIIVASNLAKIASFKGENVLVVDLNYARPQCFSFVNGHREVEMVESLIKKSESEEDNQNLWNKQMKLIMEDLIEKYDLVIYVTPPFLESVDVSFLANQTDGIVMIATVDKTPRSLFIQAFKQIQSFQIPLLGMMAISYTKISKKVKMPMLKKIPQKQPEIAQETPQSQPKWDDFL